MTKGQQLQLPDSTSIFGGSAPIPTVNMRPHPGQIEITEAMTKARIAAKKNGTTAPSIFSIIGSRGWGKTLYLVTQILMPYVIRNANARILWVGPHYQTALAFVDDVLKSTDEETDLRWVPDYDANGKKVWEFISSTASGPQVRFWNNATVTVKSADSPESIVGRGYNLIIIDEAALVDERVFVQQIMGTARKRGIKIFLITSPRGKRHWTYRYYMKGQDPKELDYMSFRQPWHKNPKFSKTLERLMKDLPDWIRKQEYEAEFLEDGDTVFKNLSNCLVGEPIEIETQEQLFDTGDVKDLTRTDLEGKKFITRAANRRFVAGLDLAKSVDYTVFWVMDMETGDCMYYRRLNKTDYRIILKHAADVCQRFNNAELIFDATGVGSGLADFFQNHNVSTHPYVFTNESKNELVVSLALAIEYNEIKIPNIQTVVNELSVFTYSLTRTGKLSYSAPSGYHDDIVMALALANWYRRQNIGNTDVNVIDDWLKINSGRPKTMQEFMEEDND